ncbi:hypothetical protein SAMN05421636_10831 [Pricia antarctica]|uniref:Uncharacterized protein n=1 Tax=Pricia antarctica TaxID=641691 RepID=A0A1G7G9H5_9FLAO|nr:hypothetical protein SAMN05421636_10831 [Pricia antarctica]
MENAFWEADELKYQNMIKKSSVLIIVMLISIGFGVGIYLQDVKHQESTTAYRQANRYNIQRFKAVERFTHQMNSDNWRTMQDSIYKQLDTLIILRFRKEMDSLNDLQKKP